MSGGGGRLSKLKDDSSPLTGDSSSLGTIVLNPGVPMMGGAGRSGYSCPFDKPGGVTAARSACLSIGVTVTGCGGTRKPCGVELMLFGESVDSAISLGFIMGVFVCGASGVEQDVISVSVRTFSLLSSDLCGVTSIILVNVTGGSGVLRMSSTSVKCKFDVCSQLSC